MTRRKLGLSAAVAGLLAGCSLLVHFDDARLDPCADGGCLDGPPGDAPAPLDAGSDVSRAGDSGDAPVDPCAALPDDASCGDADPCSLAPSCRGGHCERHPIEAGVFCAYAGACQCQYCQSGTCSDTRACPQGFNWEAGVDTARCCSGLPVLTDTNGNCGVCGVQCKTAGVTAVQNCQLLANHYQCVDCAANSECWSGCCAIDTTPNHCSESNCNTGACAPGLCPAPSQCVQGAGSPNYCTYD